MRHIGYDHCSGQFPCVPVEVDEGANWCAEIGDSIEDGAENLVAG